MPLLKISATYIAPLCLSPSPGRYFLHSYRNTLRCSKIQMPMDVTARENGLPSSALNPNAPMFVPAAYRNVEDFSDEWWSLVHSSPSFRDYWLRECFSESQFDLNCSDNFDSFLPEEDWFSFDDQIRRSEDYDSFSFGGKIRRTEDVEKEMRKDLILSKLSNWRKARAVQPPSFYEKAPKIVNVKVSPRPIHQPR